MQVVSPAPGARDGELLPGILMVQEILILHQPVDPGGPNLQDLDEATTCYLTGRCTVNTDAEETVELNWPPFDRWEGDYQPRRSNVKLRSVNKPVCRKWCWQAVARVVVSMV